LFAINFQYISPSNVFDFRLSLSIVLMPIVGGMGTVVGPVLGAILFSYLQIKLLASPALRDSYLFIYGGLLIVVMLFEPRGMVGLWERLMHRLPRRRAAAVVEAHRAWAPPLRGIGLQALRRAAGPRLGLAGGRARGDLQRHRAQRSGEDHPLLLSGRVDPSHLGEDPLPGRGALGAAERPGGEPRAGADPPDRPPLPGH